MIEDYVDIFDVTRRSNPQLLARILEAFGLNVAYLVNSKVALFTPLQLLVQEVEHREVEGPDVIPPGKVDIVVGVQ